MTYSAICLFNLVPIDNWSILCLVNSAYFRTGPDMFGLVAIENTANAGVRVWFKELFISYITRKSSKKASIVVTNRENPDKSHISGKPPGQGLKKRTCPGKPGCKVTLHVSLQTLQNINTSHQHSKNYTDFQSNSVFSHRKTLSSHIENTNKSTTYISFLQDLLIHSFFSFHMSDRHLSKGLSLSLVHDSGIHFLLILIPESLLYKYSDPSSKHISSKLRYPPRLFPISLECLSGF